MQLGKAKKGANDFLDSLRAALQGRNTLHVRILDLDAFRAGTPLGPPSA